MTNIGKQAPFLDGIRVVASSAERDALFPSPDTNQRVHNTSTGYVEKYDGANWLPVVALLKGGPTFNVKAYGAVLDGVANDTNAFAQALTDAAPVRGVVEVPHGTLLTDAFTIPDYVRVRGGANRATTIKRRSTGDLVTSMGSYAVLEHLEIDGNTASLGTGRGVLIPAGFGQFILNTEIHNFSQACLEFSANAGSGFTMVGGVCFTTGTLGTVGAIHVNGTDASAVPRHFLGVTGGGCTLYDFGGCNDFFVFGGYSNGLIFNSASAHVMITGMRCGAAAGTVTVKGGEHQFGQVVFAEPVILDASTSSVSLIGCNVPSYNITDNGVGNFFTASRAFTPAWTGSVTNPVIGNGTLDGIVTRDGTRTTVCYRMVAGSTTTFGSGTWIFAVPFYTPYTFGRHIGNAWISDASTGNVYQCPVRVDPGNSRIFVYAAGGANTFINATTPMTWAVSDELNITLTFSS